MDTLNPESGLEMQMVMAATRAKAPISGAFELVPTCNLHCKMCYLRASASRCKASDYLPVDFWLEIAKELVKNNTLFLLLTGGEPYLYPDFEKLYLELRKMGFILTINTNGTMITKESAEFLASNMPRRVNVTLYGASPETYQKVTGSAAAFDRAIQGIKNLLAAGVQVKMNVSLIPENVDELRDFHRIAKELDIPVEVNTYMYPATREPDEVYEENIRLTPEVAAKAALLNDKLIESEDDFKKRLAYMAESYSLYKEGAVMTGMELPEILPCRAATSSFWINWKGELSPCVFLDQNKSSLKECSFQEGWKKLITKRCDLCLPEKCTTCVMRRHCLVCGAACFHENKDMAKAPEYLCHMTEEKLRLAYEMVNGETIDL